MASKAVYGLRLIETETLIDPPVTRVTRRASGPVGLDTDTEVVDQVLLADGHRGSVTGDQNRIALPFPVRSLHDLVRRIGMALQTRPRHRWTIREGSFHEGGMVR